MGFKNNFYKTLALLGIIFFIIMILINPKVCTNGAARGILLCGNVIIPSLFPFTVCVLFIVKCDIGFLTKHLKKFTKAVFKMTPEQFVVMILSFIGGYPTGAKMINELYREDKISEFNAKKMISFCVNAGPAFIVIAVGSTILNSKQLGYILLLSHIVASVILAVIYSRFFKYDEIVIPPKQSLSIIDIFINSTAQSASSVIGICGYVILFSTISSYIEFFSKRFSVLNKVKYFLEVTTAISNTKNIYFISFLLGFGGICIWCQVLSLCGKCKINIFGFIITRLLHGGISVLITITLVKLINPVISTVSNYKNFHMSFSYTSLSLSISLIIMAIIFLIALNTKKYYSNLLKDLV